MRAQLRGSFANFLNSLLTFESGIDPDRHDWYVANLDVPVLECPVTTSPGQVVRDLQTGRHRIAMVTVADYFRSLGVFEHFDPADPGSLRLMQYRSTNAWGYIGYQLGEEVLREAGYYEPAKLKVEFEGCAIICPVIHIGGVPVSNWTGGRRERLLETGDGSFTVATDVNRWEGVFTGRNDVASLEDLMLPAAQELIIREVIGNNLRSLTRGLGEAGVSLTDCFALHWLASPKAAASSLEVRCTLSGIVACCHLCGSAATLDLLTSSAVPQDELGTSALDYMARFGGYAIEVGATS